jgi:hypothetical protein
MEQVVKGVTSMVINRSFQFSIFRVAIIAGIAHAVPEIKELHFSHNEIPHYLISINEAAHENAQRHRQLSCHGRRIC